MQRTLLVLLALAPALARAEEAPEEAPPAATAAARPAPSFTLAPRVGVVIPTSGLGRTVTGGLEIGYLLPVLDHRLALVLDVLAAQPTAHGRVTDPRLPAATPYDVKLSETEVMVTLAAVVRFLTADRPLVPYAGVGPTLFLLHLREDNAFDPTQHNLEESTKLGVTAMGGLDVRLGPGRLFGEARFLYGVANHRLSGDLTLGNVVLTAGYRLLW
jgi:hypothetical protein